jgi:hypothetical protein
LHALANLAGLMALEQGTPSGRAADIVLETAQSRRLRRALEAGG